MHLLPSVSAGGEGRGGEGYFALYHFMKPVNPQTTPCLLKGTNDLHPHLFSRTLPADLLPVSRSAA